MRSQREKHDFSLFSSPKCHPNPKTSFFHHPRPLVAVASRCCLPLNPHTKRNTLIRAESSESSSRIRWRKSPNPLFQSF
ncbi:hypothetical protein HKD37_05G012609 [Glycine soja]